MRPDTRLPWTAIPWFCAAGLIVGGLGPALHDLVVVGACEPWGNYVVPSGLFWAAAPAMTAAGVGFTLTAFRDWWIRVPVAAALGFLADIAGVLLSFPGPWYVSETSALCCGGAAALALMHSALAPLVRARATPIAFLWALLSGVAAGYVGIELVPRATTAGALVLAMATSATQCAALAGVFTLPSKAPSPFSLQRFRLRNALIGIALIAACLAGGTRMHYRYELDGRAAADASILDGSSPWIWTGSGWRLPRPGFVPP